MTSENDEYESVVDFYSGKSVFVTGATGLLGKVCVEKLLYTCTDIDKIYILVRNKKGVHIDQRMATFFEQPIFSRIKQEKPEALKKIIPISGDITAPNLGIKSEDEQVLIENVSVVIHSAATINFNEPLKTAFRINVEGTRQVLNLSKRIQNLKIIVYVSTAYSNTSQKIIDEIVYPPPIDLKDMKKIIENHHIRGDDEIELKKLLQFHPNTYTFTKALAENVATQEHGDVPIVIIRPSIITASEKEPLPGWIDNWGGTTGVIGSIVKGRNNLLLSENNVVVDIIPLDYVTNLTLVSAAKCHRFKSVSIFNSCTSSENPITTEVILQSLKQYNANNNVDDKSIFMTRFKFLLTLISFVTQTIPAYLADMWIKVHGKKAKYVKLHSQIVAIRDVTGYFTRNSWMIRCTNARDLFDELSICDKKLFHFDPRDIVWTEYMNIYISGILKYLLNMSITHKYETISRQ